MLLSIVAAWSQCFGYNRAFPSTTWAPIPSEIPTLSIITFRNPLAAAPLITLLWALYVNRPCLSCASRGARFGGARKGPENDDDDCALTTAITPPMGSASLYSLSYNLLNLPPLHLLWHFVVRFTNRVFNFCSDVYATEFNISYEIKSSTFLKNTVLKAIGYFHKEAKTDVWYVFGNISVLAPIKTFFKNILVLIRAYL